MKYEHKLLSKNLDEKLVRDNIKKTLQLRKESLISSIIQQIGPQDFVISHNYDQDQFELIEIFQDQIEFATSKEQKVKVFQDMMEVYKNSLDQPKVKKARSLPSLEIG
jgi:hypothetical protein